MDEEDRLVEAVKALLFVSTEPVDTITVAHALDIEPGRAEEALGALQRQLDEVESSVRLKEIAGGWRLYTAPEYDELLGRYVLSWDTRRMSQAALEVLAVVAYGQPMTRAQISEIRGVNSDSAVNTLVERGLLREAGVLEVPGNPVLYGTSRAFLEKFGLRSPDDLPDIMQFAPDEKTARLIGERLGAVQAEASQPQDSAPGVDGSAEEADESTQDAVGDVLGVVDKIDFDALEFDVDDE